MPFFESFDQKKIYYFEQTGSLPYSVFFLHGWSAQSSLMTDLTKFFPDFHFYFWDARGHGQSDPDTDASVGKMAEDFRYFLTHVYHKPYPVIAVGHSMGALTLFEYISRYHTDLLSKIAIIDQSPKLMTDSEWKLGIYGNYSPEINQEMIEAFLKDLGDGVIKLSTSGLNKEYNEMFQKKPDFFYQRKRVFNHERTLSLVSIWKTLTQADYRKIVDKINIPTLLLYGMKSQYYLQDTAFFMKEKIKDSQLHFFEKGDHSLFIQEPKRFASLISSFITEK